MIKPMLAHMYNPDKAIFPCYIQPKLDGVRCIITKKGAFSRTGKEFKNIEHIKANLKENFFNKFPDFRFVDGFNFAVFTPRNNCKFCIIEI